MARQGDCVVGFNIQKGLAKNRERGEHFTPCDLTEGNVQAIFHRCLAKETSSEKTSSILFYREFGYEKDDIGIGFDKAALRANRKNIEYLYRQLAAVHEFENIIRIEDFGKSYLGRKWTDEQGSMLRLIYLGSAQSEKILNHFDAEYNGASFYALIRPTLSPKDPAFPAWWEAHRGEWEA